MTIYGKEPVTLYPVRVTGSCDPISIIPTLRVLNETITYIVNNSDNIFYYLNIFR